MRCYAELRELAPAAEVTVPVTTPRSVKDLVEAIGVPHVEVAVIVVDEVPVGFDAIIVGGERVAVFPPFRRLPVRALVDPRDAPDPRRFVADVHLGTLARRLRLLGFDTWYANDADDAALAALAEDDGRILLSRDRQLLSRRRVLHGYLPRSDDPDEQLREVVARYDLVGRADPRTRCVSCNGVLAAATLDEVAHLVPPRTRAAFDVYARCATCEQVYWPGAHEPALDALIASARGPDGASGGAPSGAR